MRFTSRKNLAAVLAGIAAVGSMASVALPALASAAETVFCITSMGGVYVAGPGYTNLTCLAGDTTIPLTGLPGPMGPQGLQGVQGPAGLQGPVGPAGPTGPKGDQGDSAFSIATQHGFVGDVTAWLASLVGPKGDTGAQGPEGPIGPQGPAGPTISSGVLSTGSDIIVPPATVTMASSSIKNITAMGSVTMTVLVLGCKSATLPPRIIMQPQNLPANVWLQNARCNGSSTASITLITAKTDASVTVPAGTKFTYITL